MGKLSKTLDAVKDAGKALDMSRAARLKRAGDQGHSVARGENWYHGSASSGVPVSLHDVSVGGVPIYTRGKPADYSPYQFTQNPTNRDYVRAALQEQFLLDEYKLSDAAYAKGERGLLDEARAIVDGEIEAYRTDWPDAVPELERIRNRIDAGANRIAYRGGPNDAGIEAFDPDVFEDGLYGRGVYMTDSPIIAGGGEGNDIAELGYATARREGDTPTVYQLSHRVNHPWNPDKQKFRRKDLSPERLKTFEAHMHAQGHNPKGKWPMSDEAMRYYMGNDWVNGTLQDMGYDGIRHKGGQITGAPAHTVTVAFDPAQVRSVNAAFDPAKKDSANLLASMAGAGVLGAGMSEDSEAALATAEEARERFTSCMP